MLGVLFGLRAFRLHIVPCPYHRISIFTTRCSCFQQGMIYAILRILVGYWRDIVQYGFLTRFAGRKYIRHMPMIPCVQQGIHEDVEAKES